MKKISYITDKSDAHKYRLLQAEALLKLYESDTGRPCDTMEELSAWVKSSKIEGPIDPEEVFTKDELRAVLERLEQ